MNNQQTEAAWAYHNATKHSYQSVRSSAHYLDWENQPLPFKIYTSLTALPLPHDFRSSEASALAALAPSPSATQERQAPDLEALAGLLYFSAGITKTLRYLGGQIQFRAAACTGALYHIELYLICGDLPDLPAGVYHFGVHDLALRRLRQGDFRAEVLRASAGEPAIAQATAILACTSTYWRNAWKYQARTYRHCFWDSGTILANLLAMAIAHQVPARVIGGFLDSSLDRLLGLDSPKAGEATLALVALGRADPIRQRRTPQVEPLALETVPLSKREVDYPAIHAMHAASSLASVEEVAAWRQPASGGPAPLPPTPAGSLFPLAPLEDDQAPRDAIETVIRRRGSSRRFARQPLTLAQISTILQRATSGIPADFLSEPGTTLNDLYLIVHAVEGLPSGAYFYHRKQQALELLKEGDFRAQAGRLGLDQQLPAEASVDVFFMADLATVLQRFGNRGYRAVQLEAGIIGGKLYLAAYALGLGASGLTFYDDDVTDFFSPHASGKSAIFLVALGVPARRRPS